MASRGIPAGLVALLCWLAACSSGGAGGRSVGQRFADGGACPPSRSSELPAGSGCVTEVRADLDGDARPDRFAVYARLSHGTPVSWWARAVLGDSSRPTPAVRLPAATSVGGTAAIYPRVAGAADANGLPGSEVFVQLTADLYHGAAPPIDAIYDVREGRLVPVTSGGKLFTFPTAGISRFGDGARCTSDRVFTLTHVQIEPHGWTWTDHRYVWNGTQLAPVGGGGTGNLPVLNISDPRVSRHYELMCGDLRISQVTDSYPPPP